MTAVCVAKARDLMVNWNIAYVILIVGHSSPAARDFHVTFGGGGDINGFREFGCLY